MNELDDSELWMSTDSESDEIEDYESISEDATSFTMDMRPQEMVTKTVGGEGGVSGGAVVNVNTNLRAERSVEKVTTHAAKVVGNNPCDEWSNYPLAQWSLQENESQQNGIMTLFRACVLLTRDTEEDFELLPDVQVTPDLKTRLGSLMAFRRSDDPIILAPASEPLNALANDLVQKRWNLGQVDLSNIFYPSRKFGASLVVYSSRPNMEFDFTDDEFDELDVFQVQNHAVDNPKTTYEERDVEKEWKSLELDLQCLDVLDLLIDKKRRWDNTEGDEETPLLEDYKKKTIASRRDYRDRVAPTALHILAKSKRDFSRAPKNLQTNLVGYLLECRGGTCDELGPQHRGKEDLFLLVAINYNNDDFIDCVERYLGDKFSDLLHVQDGEGKNLLHHLFTWDSTKAIRDKKALLVPRLSSKAKPQTIATADNIGNTPVHYAMDCRICLDRSDEYFKAVKVMFEAGDVVIKKEQRPLFNERGESPVMFGRKIHQKFQRDYSARKMAKKEAQITALRSKLLLNYEDTATPPEPETTIDSRPKQPMGPPPADMYINPTSRDPGMNLCFDAKGQKDAKSIVHLLSRMSAGGFNDTLAYVHLPTVSHSSINAPSGRNANAAQRGSLAENPSPGRTELVKVFDKLYELKVKKILRLHVEDRHSPSHTDASIEIALQGRESFLNEGGTGGREPIAVETWDWRKPDLSTEVIAFAAPTVENVHLYWSGNQAVLRAWDCDEGIPRLYVTTERRLKRVTVHAAPGLETRDRMLAMLNRFKQEVQRKTGGGVAVKTVIRMEGLMANMDTVEDTSGPVSDEAAEKQHVWVDTMDVFRRALSSLPDLKGSKAPRVKLALIDDGINLGNLDDYNGSVTSSGVSYFPGGPWHCSSTGHGTILANMIVRVNPWVELHVVRVQDGPSRNGGRNIFAGSAAKALRYAIDKKVDIISMSWTIKNAMTGGHTSPMGSDSRNGSFSEKPSMEQRDIQALGDAIDDAAKAGILMFCSASDDIQAGAMDTLPYQKQPGYIFRIGAATYLGQRDGHTEDVKRIDYFFPGNQVAEAKNPRSSEPVKYHDGSTVGTALAAGLASLLIYCARITEHRLAEKKGQENSRMASTCVGLADALRLQKNMKQALDNIKSSQWTDAKYLPVWAIFKPKADDMEKAKDEDKWVILERLVVQLGVGIN
ncbi:Major intracellular serine protease [Colletotrichum sp. SAR 10_98]|nr:Major intracellular serine protease [Colletotrichum sp. SAR 10_98]